MKVIFRTTLWKMQFQLEMEETVWHWLFLFIRLSVDVDNIYNQRGQIACGIPRVVRCTDGGVSSVGRGTQVLWCHVPSQLHWYSELHFKTQLLFFFFLWLLFCQFQLPYYISVCKINRCQHSNIYFLKHKLFWGKAKLFWSCVLFYLILIISHSLF